MKVEITEQVSGRDERGLTAAPISDEQLKSIYNVHIVSLKPGYLVGGLPAPVAATCLSEDL